MTREVEWLSLIRAAALLPVCLLFVLGAACGDDSGGDEEDAQPTEVATATTSGTPTPVEPSAIYVVDVETLEVSKLPLEPGLYFGPAWSPDGTQIAFTRGVDIFVAKADGGAATQLTNNGRSNYLPAWSPDGQSIVFISDEGPSLQTAEVFKVDIDGQNEQRLTNDSWWDYRADWSPDGSLIMFGSEREDGWQIFTMSSDGTNEAVLATAAAGNAISWSPDGEFVAFTSDRDGDDDIYVMRPDGSDQQNLTNNEFHDDNPAWSRDGRITFSSDRSGKNEIYVMDADGGNVVQLTSNPSIEPNIPTWSPDGTQIAFGGAAVATE